MIRKIRYSENARRDLAAIKSWSVKSFGSAQTVRYFDDPKESLARLARNPGIARDASEIRPELRSLLIGSHVAYLWIRSDAIEIVRILHGRMEPEQNL